MTINGRRKGHNWEREIAKYFRDKNIFPDCKRLLEYQQGFGFDLCGTEEWRFQLKRGRKHAPISKIKEVPESTETRPALITKADRDKTYVVLEWDDFIYLLQRRKYERMLRAKVLGDE